MSDALPSRRQRLQTPRQRVLAKHPKARECIAWLNNNIFIVVGLNTIIGTGKSGPKAWADAERKL